MSATPRKQPGIRQLKVGEQIRHTLAEALRSGHFADPVLRDVTITVSEVRISPDLKAATAFVMPLGGDDTETTVSALNRASGYFRHAISKAVRLKYTPEINFKADTSFDRAERLDAILRGN
ncbi:MAG: 30S ribosome-binding factor RbfA [Pseudomonadota bacterium]|nr:30S ribosome-binding factor RbfA [Pseudomonadota bacterium]